MSIKDTQAKAEFLELKVPPLVLVGIAAFLMWVAVVVFPKFTFHFPAKTILAVAAGIFGFVVCAFGVLEFKRARTTVNPIRPSSSTSLVKTGIYRVTRNPMYVGFVMMLVAWAIAMENGISFLILPVFVFYIGRFQIDPEERILSSLFGEEFRAYCRKVRRWV